MAPWAFVCFKEIKEYLLAMKLKDACFLEGKL